MKIRCLQWSQQGGLSCGWCQSEQTIMMFPFFTSRMCLHPLAHIIGGEYFIAGVKIKIDTLKFRINQGGAHEQ